MDDRVYRRLERTLDPVRIHSEAAGHIAHFRGGHVSNYNFIGNPASYANSVLEVVLNSSPNRNGGNDVVKEDIEKVFRKAKKEGYIDLDGLNALLNQYLGFNKTNVGDHVDALSKLPITNGFIKLVDHHINIPFEEQKRI